MRSTETTPAADPAAMDHKTVDAAWRGVELCREGEWDEAFYWLSVAAESGGDSRTMPSQFFACLGFSLAMQGSIPQGLKLCRKAIDLDFYQPENYFYLARIHLLGDDRRSAIEAIERGLQSEPNHPELCSLRRDLGERRAPVLPFLPRGHVLNRKLGRLRHSLLGDPGPRA